MRSFDKTKADELLVHLSFHVAQLLDIPDIRDHIGVVLEWNLCQVDHLILTVLEDTDV